jgi:hypothetical protein
VVVPPRFIETPITVPEYQSIEEAEDYLRRLPARVARGEISFDDAEKISLLTRNYIEASIDAAKLQLQIADHGGHREQIIQIVGGLPTPPGCEGVIMPHQASQPMNGPAIDGEVIPTLAASASADSAEIPRPPNGESDQGPQSTGGST